MRGPTMERRRAFCEENRGEVCVQIREEERKRNTSEYSQ